MAATVTMKTLAAELGLSLSTISKALNDYPDVGRETRSMVLKAARQMGYMPNQMARNLAKRTNNTVGVIIPDIATSIYGEIFRSIGEAARNNGVNLFLCDTQRSEELERSYVRNLLETQVMGIIIAPNSDRISHISELTRGRVPVVYVGGKVEDPREHFVSSGNLEGGKMAVDYLCSLGHQNIVMLSDNSVSPANRKRMAGYARQMRSHGLKPRIVVNRKPGRDILASGYQMMKQLIRDGLPTAVFAVKDMLAVGMLQALSEAGLHVPEDLSIVGYDDSFVSALPMINLTTLAQPKRGMGEMAMEILLELSRGRAAEKFHRYLQPALVKRGSCSRVGKG